MNKQEAIDRLKKLQDNWNQEFSHVAADKVLCELLTTLGYEDVVKEYIKINNWYA